MRRPRTFATMIVAKRGRLDSPAGLNSVLLKDKNLDQSEPSGAVSLDLSTSTSVMGEVSPDARGEGHGRRIDRGDRLTGQGRQDQGLVAGITRCGAALLGRGR